MRITFNKYKGFLEDTAGLADEYINVNTKLPLLEQTAKTRKKNHPKHVTTGFDSLNIAWTILPFDPFGEADLDRSDSETFVTLQNNGRRLRDCCHVSISNETREDQLSSHTSLYGQEVLDQDEDENDLQSVNVDEGKKGSKFKNSLEEQRHIRHLAKNTKHKAKMDKQLKKKQTKRQSKPNDVHAEQPVESKVSILKSLLHDCLSVAGAKSGEPLLECSKIVQIEDAPIYNSDLRNLLDDEWLSDNNISWVYAFLEYGYILPLLSVKLQNSKFVQYQYEEQKHIFKSPISLLFPSFTFLIANHPDPKELVHVLPDNIKEAQFIFCPLNDNDDFASSEGGSHWSLVVFTKLLSTDHKNKNSYVQKALVFDSLYEANSLETESLVKNMAAILYNPDDSKCQADWEIVHVRDTPQQTNNSDCGVYVASITASLTAQLVSLALSGENSYIDFSLSNLRFSAVDSRIWILSTILNSLENDE